MADLVLLPNVEALVSAFLRAHAGVQAVAGGDRIFTVIPNNPTWPLVRVTQFGDEPAFPRPLHLTGASLQVEAFGGSKAQAWRLAETCRAAMAADLPGAHPDGVVTGVNLRGLADVPDDTYQPAKPRWLFTATVFVHPLRSEPAS